MHTINPSQSSQEEVAKDLKEIPIISSDYQDEDRIQYIVKDSSQSNESDVYSESVYDSEYEEEEYEEEYEEEEEEYEERHEPINSRIIIKTSTDIPPAPPYDYRSKYNDANLIRGDRIYLRYRHKLYLFLIEFHLSSDNESVFHLY